ncbi:serine protease [Haliangium sp. UPWRP_2]|nr:S8 family peptidase [Haliangium sp. UPWRP_2]PSM31336.1 serine protease [Haliangium sp. UPWRP_2]
MTEQDIADQYIVQLRDKSDPEQLAASLGVTPRYVYRDAIVGFAACLSLDQLAQLRANPQVKAVEKDQLVKAGTTQMLTGGQPWGIDRIDQHSAPPNMSYSYYETGPSVRAYVIDTGIEWYHGEFSGRATAMFDAFGGDGDDYNGHGTHVAGTIGGTTYGVAKQIMLRGVRVLDRDGSGSIAGVIAGVNWVTADAIKPAIANMSLGGGYSSALNDAVTALSKSGVFIGVAAGNESVDACGGSPSSAFGAMVVGSTTSTDTFSSFSNYGPCVDILAPGKASSRLQSRAALPCSAERRWRHRTSLEPRPCSSSGWAI